MPTRKTLKIFVASSAEVSEERNGFKNQVLAVAKNHPHLILEPINWELDIEHANYPGFENAQAAINPLLLDCDLIVFIMYSKIGKFTREEFEFAVKNNKRYFIYFKTDYSPTLETLSAYTELLTFKKELQGKILPIDFKTPLDFDRLFFQNLSKFVSKKYPPTLDIEDNQTNLQLSDTVKTLLKQQAENNEKIDRLLQLLEQKPSDEAALSLEKLNTEKENILLELSGSKEIIALQQQDKKKLEERLQQQEEEDELKSKALDEIKSGRYESAEQLLVESNRIHQVKSASNYYELANLKKIQLLFREASIYLNKAVEEYPEHLGYLFEASQLQLNLGYVNEALKKLKLCMILKDKQSNKKDEQYLKIIIHLANALYANRSDHEANIYAKESLDLCIELKGTDDMNTVMCYSLFGLTLANLEKYQEAIDTYKKGLAILQDQGIEDIQLSGLYNNLGLSLTELGKADDALYYFNLALEIDRKKFGPDDWIIAIRENNIGRAYSIQEKFNEALKCFEKAVNIGEKVFPNGHPDLIVFYENYSVILMKCGHYLKAIHYAEKAIDMGFEFFEPTHIRIGMLQNELGVIYLMNDQYKLAIDMFNKAIPIFLNSAMINPHFRVGNIYNNIGECYRYLTEYKLAEENYTLAATSFDLVIKEDHKDYGVLFNSWGLLYFDKNEYDKAIQYFAKAVFVFESIYGENHLMNMTYYLNLSESYKQNNQMEAYEKLKQKIELIKQ